MTKTITVPASQLRALITDLLRTAGTDVTLPMLVGIRLHTDTLNKQSVLVGASTDRFTLGQAHADATGHLPETFLPATSCKRALAMLKLIDSGVLVELAADSGHLSFSGGDLTARLDTGATEFPETHRIFDSLTNLEPAPGGTAAAFEPAFLNRFVAIAKARREPMHIATTGTATGALITIGDRYRGLLMPQRKDLPAAQWFLPPSELAAIEKAKAEQAAAELKAKRSAAAKKAAATRAASRAAAQAAPSVKKRKAA